MCPCYLAFFSFFSGCQPFAEIAMAMKVVCSSNAMRAGKSFSVAMDPCTSTRLRVQYLLWFVDIGIEGVLKTMFYISYVCY